MKLGIKERILLLNLLPAQGDFTTMKAIQNLRDGLIFTEDEVGRFGIKQDDQRIIWDVAVDEDVEIVIGPVGNTVVIDALKKLDEEKRLIADHLELWEKFVENPKGS